jgi:glycopeptide antibiotics resistance protein
LNLDDDFEITQSFEKTIKIPENLDADGLDAISNVLGRMVGESMQRWLSSNGTMAMGERISYKIVVVPREYF